MSAPEMPRAARHGGTNPLIMVGVDGSSASISALRWAVEEAGRTGSGVEAVYIYANPSQTTWYVGGHPGVLPPDHDTVIQSARNELDRAVWRAIGDSNSVPLATVVVPDPSAADGLTRSAAHAELLVIGAHHASGLGRVFGSTAAAVLRHAPCPVVVVPGVAATRDPERPDRLVPTGSGC